MIGLYENTEIDFTELGMLSIMQLEEIAETICLNALEHARPPTAHATQKADLADLLQEPTFLQRFKVGIAQGMTHLLATHDTRVLAAYLYDETSNTLTQTATYSTSAAMTHLLFLVSMRSAALYVLAEALDKALVREVNKLPSSPLNQDDSLLNPLFTTQADVAENKGYAMLLSPALASRLTIWKRE